MGGLAGGLGGGIGGGALVPEIGSGIPSGSSTAAAPDPDTGLGVPTF